MMKMTTGDDSPSGGVPERGLDWFFVAIEACGGGTSHLGFFLMVSLFIGFFGRRLKEISPRGNNKVLIYISLYHDKCLLFMLELN